MSGLHRGAVLAMLFLFEWVCQGQEAKKTSSVHILVVNPDGFALDGHLEMLSDSTSLDTRVTRGDLKVEVPYGTYSVEFSSPFTKDYRRRVEVQSPHLLVIITPELVSFHSLELSPRSVTVKVKDGNRCSGPGPVWVKLTGVLFDSSMISEVRGGYAYFEGLIHGNYIAVVMEGSVIRGIYPVRTASDHTQIDVALLSCDKPGMVDGLPVK